MASESLITTLDDERWSHIAFYDHEVNRNNEATYPVPMWLMQSSLRTALQRVEAAEKERDWISKEATRHFNAFQALVTERDHMSRALDAACSSPLGGHSRDYFLAQTATPKEESDGNT